VISGEREETVGDIGGTEELIGVLPPILEPLDPPSMVSRSVLRKGIGREKEFLGFGIVSAARSSSVSDCALMSIAIKASVGFPVYYNEQKGGD